MYILNSHVLLTKSVCPYVGCVRYPWFLMKALMTSVRIRRLKMGVEGVEVRVI